MSAAVPANSDPVTYNSPGEVIVPPKNLFTVLYQHYNPNKMSPTEAGAYAKETGKSFFRPSPSDDSALILTQLQPDGSVLHSRFHLVDTMRKADMNLFFPGALAGGGGKRKTRRNKKLRLKRSRKSKAVRK